MLETKTRIAADGAAVMEVLGRVDTVTASQLTDAATRAQNDGATRLTLDFAGVDYISSSGLRAVLGTAKLFGDALLKVTRSNADIYEIFQTTGFTDMLQIEKPLRKISLAGCEVIGKGSVGTLYRLDEETIVKVYEPHIQQEAIDRERANARAALKCGLPCAIIYDTVDAGGKIGVVYEMLHAHTLAEIIEGDAAGVTQSADWMHKNISDALRKAHLAKYAKDMAQMAKKLHSSDASGTGVPSVKEMWLGWTDRLKGVASEAQIAEARRRILSQSDAQTFVHGNLHPQNIMAQNGEYLLMDMGDVGYGSPLFDLAATSACLEHSAQRMAPAPCQEAYGMSPQVCAEFYKEFIQCYAEGEDLAALQKQISELAAVRQLLGLAQQPG
jgi:uncharacterized protein (TIGR02172 family)